jgi:hypothetical protein
MGSAQVAPKQPARVDRLGLPAGRTVALPETHRRWLVRYGLVATAITNLVINSVFAWAATVGHGRVPLWSTPLIGGPSIVASTVGLLVVLPLTTSVICTGSIRIYQRADLGPLRPDQVPRPLRRLVVGPVRRGLYLSALSAVVLGPAAVLVSLLAAEHGLSRFGFVASQGLLGVALGALVTPAIAVAAMAETGRIVR